MGATKNTHGTTRRCIPEEDTKKSVKREHARTAKRVGGKKGKKHVRGSSISWKIPPTKLEKKTNFSLEA
jgi:hypothetical protein